METDKLSKKQEVGGGLVVASFVIFFILIVLFIFSPVSYYLEKWDNYWNNKKTIPLQLSQSSEEYEIYHKAYKKADNDCDIRTKSYFNSSIISSYASSTSENYETYDCYGVKYTKIK